MQVRHYLCHVTGDNAIRHIFQARIPIQRYPASPLGGPLKVHMGADGSGKLRLRELRTLLKFWQFEVHSYLQEQKNVLVVN